MMKDNNSYDFKCQQIIGKKIIQLNNSNKKMKLQ